MDREKDQGKRKVIERLFQVVDSEFQRLIAKINDDLKSRWIGKDQKAMLMAIKEFLELVTAQNELLMSSVFTLDNMQTRLVNLEKIVHRVTPKIDVDLSDMKTQIEALTKSIERPEFKNMEEFLQVYEKLKNKRAKWLQENR